MQEKLLPCPFEKEEWESWRENVLTGWFMDSFLSNHAANAKQTFIDYAWGRVEIDPVYHASLYERAKVLSEIKELTFEDLDVFGK